MDNPADEQVSCEHCGSPVTADDDFCSDCGKILIDNIDCVNHYAVAAAGACIICSSAFCNECGFFVKNKFLCNAHRTYEIFQGMARVYGTLDDLAAQYAKSILEQEGLHPFIFCRQQPHGGARFVQTLFGADGDHLGKLVNEIKVMLPCQEVLQAEEVLKSIRIIE